MMGLSTISPRLLSVKNNVWYSVFPAFLVKVRELLSSMFVLNVSSLFMPHSMYNLETIVIPSAATRMITTRITELKIGFSPQHKSIYIS